MVAACLLLWGCGRLGFESLPLEPSDAGMDAGHEPRLDAGMDAMTPPPMDAGRDVGVPIDAGMDAGMDAGRDAGPPDMDSGQDDAGFDAGPPPLGTFCEDVRALATAPVIDGVLEPGLSLKSAPKLDWFGARPLPDDHDASYAVAYRSDGLYVFVAVEDPNLLPAPPADWEYCGDGVEVYLDADGMFPSAPLYDVPGTIQFITSAPIDSSTPQARGSRWNNVTFALGAWTSSEFGAFPTPTGYAFEGMFRAADLGLASWTLSPTNSVGLALGINVAVQANDPDALCGHRLGQYFNRVALTPNGACGTGPFCTTDAFCSAPLVP